MLPATHSLLDKYIKNVLGATLNDVQSLIRDLHSEIASGGAQRTLWDVGDLMQIGHVQSKQLQK